MAELIHQYKKRFSNQSGVEYTVQAWGDRNADGSWQGWFEFRPLDDLHGTLQTEKKVSESKRIDLTYWASKVEHAHLEEAFNHARSVPESVSPN